ncbi:hypothetical protein GUJ93_ZPchr0010g9142 [Zizania palustris]|uniref:FAM91 N-terminal domain-containing protein n=1 Tax=Zizania palustris TaxID=103762 RepID=A0A8J5W9E6_ZIZPA|nr:hypothetical protein GUJ93_ZPchr0010g9142 [Zizania palustris]
MDLLFCAQSVQRRRILRGIDALSPQKPCNYICRVMRISPFRYYCDVLFEAMKNEQPYDSIPNFSAADALRITGVGRNEFIDIMNKCRSKIMWKLSKSIAKELLPGLPADLAIEPWWGVRFVNFTLEEFKKLSEEETSAIDKISKEEVNSYVLFDPEVINGLYKRGMVYFDVPVYPDDRFRVLDSSFRRIMGSSNILKLGYNFQCDLHQLSQSYGELKCFQYYEMLLDIQKLFKGATGGLSGLSKKILGAGLNKTRRNSNWEERPLSQNQKEYAALDAVVLVHIFHHVKGQSQFGVTEGCKVEWKSHIVSQVNSSRSPLRF